MMAWIVLVVRGVRGFGCSGQRGQLGAKCCWRESKGNEFRLLARSVNILISALPITHHLVHYLTWPWDYDLKLVHSPLSILSGNVARTIIGGDHGASSSCVSHPSSQVGFEEPYPTAYTSR